MMRLLFLAVVVFAVAGAGHAQNRIARESDRVRYGPYITPGDLIIDTPTREKDGKREVVYYFMPKQWPMLREGGTIWIDGEKLGPVDMIKFCNTSRSLNAWHIESASIRNIPDTQVRSKAFVCQGLKHFVLDGQSEAYPGLSAWPAQRKFLTGAFGFYVTGNLEGGHAYSIDVRHGGTLRMNGFEAQHAFSGVRISGGKYDVTISSVTISNFYIHDTGSGEGFYIGSTQSPPYAKLENLVIRHGIIARTGAEGIQVQHLAGNANIHNVTIFAADARWINQFGRGQDTGIQWSVDGGENNSLHHVIVDGYASIGMIPFGAPGMEGGRSRVHNVLFNDGRDTGIYLHNSGSNGVEWVFEDLYFRGINETYYKQTGRNERNYLVSRKYGTDRVIFKNIYHDGCKVKTFEDPTGIEYSNVNKVTLEPPVYVNSGFHEPAHRIKQWHPHYASYFPVSRRGSETIQVLTEWKEGDIAIETVGEYAFFKCRRSHVADDRRPADHPFFVRLTWDANGVRSDQPGWNKSLPQSAFPPDDLRLKPGNIWKKKGFGFQAELLEAAH